jgi:hypothetical protein
MANRYGRRQRRKHRAAIEFAEHELTKLTLHALNMGRQLDAKTTRLERLEQAMQRWDREVTYLLGPFTALRFKTPEVPHKGPPPGRMRVHQPLSAGPMEFSAEKTESLEYRVEMMMQLLYSLDEDPTMGEIRRLLRVRGYRLDWDAPIGDAAYYSFSEAFWNEITSPRAREAGATDRFVHDIAVRVMELLSNSAQKRQGSTRRTG